jgi:cytochrome c2
LILSRFFFISLSIGAAASTNHQTEDKGREIFELKCKSCHTIGGGDLVGPDLKGVTERREREWLLSFIAEPGVKFSENDPIASELLEKYNNIVMPNLSLTESEIEALLAFIESGESSTPAEVELPPGDAQRGAQFFIGQRRLQNDGIACMSCHTVSGVGTLGGGNLGPDLTKVFTRYGEAGLVSSLQNISFPTMLNVYLNKPLTNQEVADLVSFFEQSNTQSAGAAQQAARVFWIAGGIGALLFFGVMVFFWPSQRESLSEKLRRQR